MIYYETELYHHGVKGMKWGVRRYQNKDGSLTSEGRKRLTDDLILNSPQYANKTRSVNQTDYHRYERYLRNEVVPHLDIETQNNIKKIRKEVENAPIATSADFQRHVKSVKPMIEKYLSSNYKIKVRELERYNGEFMDELIAELIL